MSWFYVGQRVRVIHVTDSRNLGVLGSEGLVNELDCRNEGGCGGRIGVTIGADTDWCFLPCDIEPATDSYEKTSWSECVWQPASLTRHSEQDVPA